MMTALLMNNGDKKFLIPFLKGEAFYPDHPSSNYANSVILKIVNIISTVFSVTRQDGSNSFGMSCGEDSSI